MNALRAAWLEFVGEETTPAGTASILGLAALGGYLAPRLAGRRLGAARATLLVVAAVDLWGGVLANNTVACARWYERPGQTDADHLRFAVAHVHPLALAWLDGGGRTRWRWAVANYGYLLAATALIRYARRHRRAAGVVTTLGGICVDRALGPSNTAPWFGPVFYSKLLLGHAGAALWSDATLAARR
ncbi:hypothetical protein [Mycolicibacterium monacense]|uniref:Uncharacterized protein n=4 Tax=Mycobacteriaceae TaxID=1762 RepID=A0AAD1MZ11_MYCMB|nr:hypothetical protein [Mycolicibacterium monacense]MDA4104980.1 hypothetical protein [Mycolicibacterium monacense DSM 44395]OBF56944.1 hypothetical protein A5778_05655 [Mycolicibacterium monacense]ORB23846.1 hypothetical protein BST34_02230 [Mycolicibacterium monacense DSM 44395]QHP85895.1 hypothetical protein EWR22_11190 [Mycolicibacterium monacense DSM 44395]BBZ61179.1 hypothetical protein MMON_24800 [Mycolicibacterium monacense]